MIDFGIWMGAAGYLAGHEAALEPQRAANAWRLIQENPSTITLKREGVTQAAQTVRVDSDDRAVRVISEAGAAPIRGVVVFGVRNHPDDAVADTAIVEGDTFNFGDDLYKVIDVILPLGEVQAICEASG